MTISFTPSAPPRLMICSSAERLTISAAEDGDDFAKACDIESEHPIKKNLAVEIGLAEAVRSRIELGLVLFDREPEWIELGVEVPAGAVGADQHQRADRVARRLLHLSLGNFDAPALRLALDLVAERLLDLTPVAVSTTARWRS